MLKKGMKKKKQGESLGISYPFSRGIHLIESQSQMNQGRKTRTNSGFLL